MGGQFVLADFSATAAALFGRAVTIAWKFLPGKLRWVAYNPVAGLVDFPSPPVISAGSSPLRQTLGGKHADLAWPDRACRQRAGRRGTRMRLSIARWALVLTGAALLVVAVLGESARPLLAQEPSEPPEGVATDRAALMALYVATDGANWTRNDNWGSGEPLRRWHGVTADAEGRVTSLILRRNNLSGLIPAQLGDLANLRTLNFIDNALRGPIPAALGSLAQLEELSLRKNELRGPIPAALDGLANLEILALDDNALSGPIPAALGDLANLTRLWLARNDLSGSIPSSLGDLGALTQLWLDGNPLSGRIPDALGNLGNLTYLSLSGNGLRGPIPVRLGDLTVLEHLDLGGNDLRGSIPAWLGELAALEHLNLGGSGLRGSIPAWLGELAALEHLGLGNNALRGPIPVQLGSLVNLQLLQLGGNQLTGPIPAALGNLTSLELLDLWGNRLSGPIPPEMGNLTALKYLLMGRNELSGPIPDTFGNLVNLEILALPFNRLRGPLPAALGDLTALTTLWMGYNQFDGPLPPELGRLAKLEQLSFPSNQLSGPIPLELGNLASLQDLDLEDNRLSGPIPPELGNLANLTGMNLEDNRLSGPIPPELGNLSNLAGLFLTNNQLSGPIPASLGELPALGLLWLRGNAGLSGCIPHSLRDLLDAPEPTPGLPAQDLLALRLPFCLLRDLRLTGADLEPSFDEGTAAYTAAVGRSVATAVLTATPHDAGDDIAIYKGRTRYSSGETLPLSLGTNDFLIALTPRDGTRVHSVTVTVTRLAFDPITLNLREGGDLVVVPAGAATTAADLFGGTDVAIVWQYNRASRAWDRSYLPALGGGGFPIAGGDVLWVVSPRAQTLTVAGRPPPASPVADPITLDLREGGDLVVVPAGLPTTAGDLFGGTDVAIVWQYNRASRAWDRSYLPALGGGGLPIAPGDVLWVVAPRALTVTAGAPAGAAVSGRVTFGGGEVTLPEGAVVTVQLLDTSLADAAATLIGEQIIRDARGLPLAFRVGYDPAAIDERNEYSLQATVRHAGRLLYINDTVHPVLTRGAPRNSDIEVIRVQ